MTILGKDKIHYIEKVLLYTPIMVGIFIALSVWGEGFTLGFMGIALILIGVLLYGIKKSAGNNRRFVPHMSSLIVVVIGGYCLGRVDICKAIYNRRGEVPSPIDQYELEIPNRTG